MKNKILKEDNITDQGFKIYQWPSTPPITGWKNTLFTILFFGGIFLCIVGMFWSLFRWVISH